MTGPDHYAEAELLLSQSFQGRSYPETSYVALAQVHATLALAAATALTGNDPSYGQWQRAVLGNTTTKNRETPQ